MSMALVCWKPPPPLHNTIYEIVKQQVARLVLGFNYSLLISCHAGCMPLVWHMEPPIPISRNLSNKWHG